MAVNLVDLPLDLSGARFNVLILLNLTVSFAMGWIGARLLPGREWALALMYTVVTSCITLPILWHVFFVFPFRDHLPVHFRAVLIGAQALRQAIFWLGSLPLRYVNNRKHSSIVAAAKSA